MSFIAFFSLITTIVLVLGMTEISEIICLIAHRVHKRFRK